MSDDNKAPAPAATGRGKEKESSYVQANITLPTARRNGEELDRILTQLDHEEEAAENSRAAVSYLRLFLEFLCTHDPGYDHDARVRLGKELERRTWKLEDWDFDLERRRLQAQLDHHDAVVEERMRDRSAAHELRAKMNYWEPPTSMEVPAKNGRTRSVLSFDPLASEYEQLKQRFGL